MGNYQIITGDFGAPEAGPLGTSAWAKLVDPDGNVVSYAVGYDEEDAVKEAAGLAGLLVVSHEEA